MRHFIDNPPWQHILFQPQHTFVAGTDGHLLTDYLGRVEEMQASYDEAAQRIGIPTAPLERVNASSRRDYRDYYDQPLIDGVAKLYARDLECVRLRVLTTMYPNPRKTSTIRPLGPVDIAQLREAVLAIPEPLWDAENASKPNRFGALDATRHIVLRFVSNFRDWRESHDRPLWPEWKSLLEPVLAAATAPYGYARGAFPRVMLARMAPGGVIHPHRDENPAAKWPHKIHVPLVTNDQVTFFVDGVGYQLPEGEAVEVNNMGVHGGRKSRLDRPHPPDLRILRPRPARAGMASATPTLRPRPSPRSSTPPGRASARASAISCGLRVARRAVDARAS